MDADTIVALREAAKECTERGLSVAAKWASELALSVSPSKRTPAVVDPLKFRTSTPARSRSPRAQFHAQTPTAPSMIVAATEIRHPHAPSLQLLTPEAVQQELEWEAQDHDMLAAAQSFFAAKEFVRAAHGLRSCQSSKARFLSIYSEYMMTEKKALRDWYKAENTRTQPTTPVNTFLIKLLERVQDSTDPWLLFLKALFLYRLSRREEAIESALLSIAGYPWNWSVWTVLGECLGDGEELSSILPLVPLPQSHPLVQMFQVKTLNSFNSPSENELALCDRLLGEDFFPRSLWVMSLRACVLYHMHDFSQAQTQFKKILAIDPYRIDDIDVYSNILYVTENQIQLSKLVLTFLGIDKDRPELCCLIGNYYSLRAEHEKAVKYFRRATQLDRTYLSAWTLMGHEYVEMKNSHAAIEAYRKAVDVNRKDYRAWYGLGQAYELLSMHQYALYYYQHATALRPYDVRIWQAQGMCYEEMGQTRQAIDCLQRALIGADPQEINIHLKLAKLHHDLKQEQVAVEYHRHIVEVCRANNKPVSEYAKSSVYVGRYALSRGEELGLAKEFLDPIAASNSEEVGVATDLLKKVKSLLAAETQDPVQGPVHEPDQAPVGVGAV